MTLGKSINVSVSRFLLIRAVDPRPRQGHNSHVLSLVPPNTGQLGTGDNVRPPGQSWGP